MNYKSRITIALFATASVTPAYAADSIYSFVLPSGVSIRIVEAPFNRMPESACPGLKRRVQPGDYKPQTYVKAIEATYQDQHVNFEVACMTDAWNGRPLSHKNGPRYFGGWCEIAQGLPYCAFRGVFSDASESYVAEWSAHGYRAKRTVHSSSSDLIDLFLKNIDPPKY